MCVVLVKVRDQTRCLNELLYEVNYSNVINDEPFSVQVPCATLSDVINHLVEKTDGALVPLIIEEEYEKNICA